MKITNQISNLTKFLSIAILSSSIFTFGCSQLNGLGESKPEENKVENDLSNLDGDGLIEQCLLNIEKMNFSESLKYCNKAADQNDARAQTVLGTLYEGGFGVDQDYLTAFNWYKKSAEQNLPLAQMNLGRFYEQGLEINQDYAEALKWYQRAATNGHAPALNSIGNYIENGDLSSK